MHNKCVGCLKFSSINIFVSFYFFLFILFYFLIQSATSLETSILKAIQSRNLSLLSFFFYFFFSFRSWTRYQWPGSIYQGKNRFGAGSKTCFWYFYLKSHPSLTNFVTYKIIFLKLYTPFHLQRQRIKIFYEFFFNFFL